MTVQELIEQLRALPSEMPVLVEGYETGYDDIVNLKPQVRIPANVTGHSGDRDRFAHGHHAGESFVL